MRPRLSGFLMIGILGSLSGCGPSPSGPGMESVSPPEFIPLSSPEVSWLVGEWVTDPGYESKRIIVQASPRGLVYEWHRNLVVDEQQGPEPIICSYRYFTDRFGVRRGKVETAGAGDFTVVAQMNRVEVIPEDGISTGCVSFVEQESSNIKAVPYVFDIVRGRGGELIQDGWVHRKVER